jgi:outer membrane protein assembly factor BamA
MVLFVTASLMPAACWTAALAQRAAPPAKQDEEKAEPVYHLLGFHLSGTKRVDTDKLVDSLPQHEGDVITQAQIKEDAQRISDALKAHHVHGNMTTGILEREGPGHHIWVMWDLQPTDAIAMTPKIVRRSLASQSFSGNTKLSTAALIAATGLHPGQRMPDGSVDDARTGIEQAYDTALHGAPVQVNGKVRFKPDHTVIIDWMITEPK